MLTIYGASDDLIEIEGDINEEFRAYDFDPDVVIACSDGALWRVSYTNHGVWRFTSLGPMRDGWTKTEGTDPDGDYTDRITCAHHLDWIVLGDQHARLTAPAAR